MAPVPIPTEAMAGLKAKRYPHPYPRGQRKLLVLYWADSGGVRGYRAE